MDTTVDPVIIGVQIALTGMLVVFLALLLVALLLGLLRRIDMPAARSAPAEAAPAPMQPHKLPADHLSPELLVLIATAAAEMIGQPVRITRVRYHGQPPTGVWSQQGRLTIMASRQRRR